MDAPLRSPALWVSQTNFLWLWGLVVSFFFLFLFMTPNLQSKGVKWGCKVIWGQREPLEVVKYPSFNSQFWPQTIRTIPEEVFEKIYIKCLRPAGHKLHKCRYGIHSIQGRGGEFIFQADMQGWLMGRLWPRRMGDHASRVSLFKMGKKIQQNSFHYLHIFNLLLTVCVYFKQETGRYHQLSDLQIDEYCLFCPSWCHMVILMKYDNIFNPLSSFWSLLYFDCTVQRSACCFGENASDWMRQLHF